MNVTLWNIPAGVTGWLEMEPQAADDWLVEDLIYRNTIAVIDGLGSSGKSYIAMHLAFSIASGTPFLGLLPVQQGRVLVLNGEDPESISHRRFRNIVRNYEEYLGEEDIINTAKDITYISLSSVDISPILVDAYLNRTQTFMNLQKFCKEWKPDLVILDPLICFVANENDSSYAMQFYLSLRKLNSTVLICHHNNKISMNRRSDAQTEDRAKARGSSVWVENARTRMHLKKGVIHIEKNNYSERGRGDIYLTFAGGMFHAKKIVWEHNQGKDRERAEKDIEPDVEPFGDDAYTEKNRKGGYHDPLGLN